MSTCHICGAPGAKGLFSVSADEAAQHYVLKEADSDRHQSLKAHISKLWGSDTCTVRQCETCQFGFADPYVAGDTLFYKLAFERAGYPSDRWEFYRTITALEQMQFSGARILEVGSGFGLFLDKIVDRFVPRAGITALEFGDPAMATLRAKGYEARQEDIRASELTLGFDAVFMFQVLEHMDGLDELFTRLQVLLAPGGSLFVSVPNLLWIGFNETNGSLLDMPPNHIGRWSPAAFQTIAQRHGLQLVAVETEPFSLSEFVKQDATYSYLRRSQVSGSLANRSRAQRAGVAGKLISAAVALLSAPARVPVWAKAAQTQDLGGTLWVHFSKAV